MLVEHGKIGRNNKFRERKLTKATKGIQHARLNIMKFEKLIIKPKIVSILF